MESIASNDGTKQREVALDNSGWPSTARRWDNGRAQTTTLFPRLTRYEALPICEIRIPPAIARDHARYGAGGLRLNCLMDNDPRLLPDAASGQGRHGHRLPRENNADERAARAEFFPARWVRIPGCAAISPGSKAATKAAPCEISRRAERASRGRQLL